MSQVVSHSTVDEAGAAALRAPRADIVEERDEGDGTYSCVEGPFRSYERRLDLTARPDGKWDATETTTFQVGIPVWGVLFVPALRRALRNRREGFPWWSPPCRIDARAARVLGLLCTASLVAGYLGTLITQTITYAADQFGVGSTTQGNVLSAVRIGILGSLFLSALADRRGRRRLLLICMVGGCTAAAAGALAPDMWALGATQTVARAFSTTLALLIVVIAAEEMPKDSRAYAAGVLAMAAGLGAGMCLWLLPLAGLGASGWRILYVAPLAALPLVRSIGRALPESRRFVEHSADAVRRRVSMVGHRGRLAMLATASFLGSLFLAPASQLQNDFLKTEHHFGPGLITLFSLCTGTPAGLGILAGGRLAEVRGRKVVGAVGLAGGAILTGLSYQLSGPGLWLCALFGAMVAAMTIPALGIYGPELFPTALRGKANGIIGLVGVLGSAAGLQVGSRLADRYGRHVLVAGKLKLVPDYGPGLALLALGPILMALVVLFLYPETAHRELEDLNPEDADASTLALAGPDGLP